MSGPVETLAAALLDAFTMQSWDPKDRQYSRAAAEKAMAKALQDVGPVALVQAAWAIRIPTQGGPTWSPNGLGHHYLLGIRTDSTVVLDDQLTEVHALVRTPLGEARERLPSLESAKRWAEGKAHELGALT